MAATTSAGGCSDVNQAADRCGPSRSVIRDRRWSADSLAQRLADLRTVRSGGHPWTVAGVSERLVDGGFRDVGEIETVWNVPVQLVVGRR